MVGLCRVLLERILVFVNSIVYVLVMVACAVGCCVPRRLHRHKFHLILCRVLNAVHPVGDVFSQAAAIGMHGSLLSVGIVGVLVFVNHRVEAVFDETVVGEVVLRLLHEERVLGGDDAAVKHAVADGSVDKAVFVTQNVSLVDVTRVK